MNGQLNIYSGQENYMWMSVAADYARISTLSFFNWKEEMCVFSIICLIVCYNVLCFKEDFECINTGLCACQ